MNISGEKRTVTIPWGPGTRVPPANLFEEAEIRERIDRLDESVRHHVEASPKGSGTGSSGSGSTKDLDPSPDRILRKQRVGGKSYVFSLETSGQGVDLKPVDLIDKGVGNRWERLAHWENGQLVSFSQINESESGCISSFSMKVNDNGTMTYITSGPAETPAD